MKSFLKKSKERKFYEKVSKWTRSKSKGFTFVETLAVIAITAALAAGSTVSISKLVELAKRTAARNQIDQLSAAIQYYFLDCGCFPTTQQGIWALWECPELYPVPENWKGPYLDRKPGVDPWGTNIKYYSIEDALMPASVPENMPFVLISCGADKKEGGEGNGKDINSWE